MCPAAQDRGWCPGCQTACEVPLRVWPERKAACCKPGSDGGWLLRVPSQLRQGVAFTPLTWGGQGPGRSAVAPMLLEAFQGRAVWILLLGWTVRPREAWWGDS